jgi:hypothetical protein
MSIAKARKGLWVSNVMPYKRKNTMNLVILGKYEEVKEGSYEGSKEQCRCKSKRILVLSKHDFDPAKAQEGGNGE